ncbi:bifunctional 2-polyprenyl-6-hydroxyphenol methylase/3-demethylubiquinol 3-O-methyltransferase UbiG [Variovorax sp. 770b2]|uniref:class I SAM-dependent methyltransferase n=1 Tax=Variovorax sp. 770b2 TaxID=1566271 RepID=UPI0008F2BDEB|nr:class I SAM-dependent methyltransferase [Variovorax sp. 770b2]SFP35599.1 Nodulation protein S (NodS) [Variovorax sp. 770b2]
MSTNNTSNDQRPYFDALYSASEDPYALRQRWYEARKRALLLAALPQARYRRVYEPGCGIGELTLALSHRCDQLLASDFSTHAVEIARKRTEGRANVRVARHVLPADWPREDGRFDLIVLSELGYFLDRNDMQRLARCCEETLEADGTLVACDWRPDFAQRSLSTKDVHGALAALGLARLALHEEDDFVLQVWTRDSRSVAEREGIR